MKNYLRKLIQGFCKNKASQDIEQKKTVIPLEVGADEILIITTPNRLSKEQMISIQGTWYEAIASRKQVMVFSGDFSFYVIKRPQLIGGLS